MDYLIERRGLDFVGHGRPVIPLLDVSGVDNEAGVFAEQAFAADVQMPAAGLHGNVVGVGPGECTVTSVSRRMSGVTLKMIL